MKKNFDVTGMTCSACSNRVEKAVSHVPGVEDVNVNLLKNSMTVDYDETKTGLEQIIQAVTDAGYGASEKQAAGSPAAKSVDPTLAAKKEAAQMKTRLYVSLFFAAILMMLAMGPMVGMPLPEVMSGTKGAPINALTQFLLALPVVFVNFKYFTVGFKTLWQRSPNMDSLVAIGSSASMLFGLFALYMMLYALGQGDEATLHHYAHNLYFDSAAMILALITLGKYFESRAKHKTTDAISQLMSLVPDKAVVLKDGKETEVPVSSVQVRDIVVLKTGSRVPVDGIVVKGSGALDESSLTGESIPVDKKEGEELSASTLLTQGYIEMRATKVGGDTALAQIIKLVDEATSTKAPVARLADKVSGIFVPTVISIAIIAAIVWMLCGYSWEFALEIAVSVLVISCPCALGLATPTAIMVGTGRGARNGILFRSAEAIESLEKVDAVVLDKTGTVTSGKPSLTDVIAFGNVKPEELLTLVASVEQKSEHPLATAIVEGAQALNLSLKEASDFVQQLGNISGTCDGKSVRIGNKSVISSEDAKTKELADGLADEGKTPLYVIADGKMVGLLAIADPIRPDSKQAIEAMQAKGKEVWMLTGDNEKTARAVATRVGIKNVRGEVKPAAKEAVVRELQARGKKVLMVGDGINDAPSLVRADVGAAIGAGTDVAIEAADVVLMKSRLSDVVNASALSHSTMLNIRENLFWAFIYNIIGIPVAAGVFYTAFGWILNPMIAAAAMSMSSVSVVTNALRLRGWKPVLRDSGNSDKSSDQVLLPSLRQLADVAVEAEQKDATGFVYKVGVEDMMCEHCVKAVKGALEKIPGVGSADVSLEQKSAVVRADRALSQEEVTDAIKAEDYEVTSFEAVSTPKEAVAIKIDGMMCEYCVKAVTKALSGIDGVTVLSVSLEDGLAKVAVPEGFDTEKLKAPIEDEGYQVVNIE
ncbi:heavy metal translocating P-type ATPase [Parasutterella excrementihominis]|uniref:heavy metal translocating P-type ATPase n=1 Tax=Parasutterella excrementihominis TaxID=487175 RepID=UPI00356756EB